MCTKCIIWRVVSYVLLLGATLYGTIMKPTRVQAGEKCPTILNDYGRLNQVRHGFKFKPHVTSDALLVCSEQV